MNTEVTIYHKWEKGSYKKKKLMWYNIQAAVYYFNKWGWIFDKYRSQINNKLINQYK
jgi:hypothetical protein